MEEGVTGRKRAVARTGRTAVSNGFSRAQRFEIQRTILYRVSGDIEWHEGIVENISRSGIQFRAKGLIEVGAAVELNFVLPVETLVGAGVEVMCWGVVVRSVLPTEADPLTRLGARFWAYQALSTGAESAPRLLYWDGMDSEASAPALTACESELSNPNFEQECSVRK